MKRGEARGGERGGAVLVRRFSWCCGGYSAGGWSKGVVYLCLTLYSTWQSQPLVFSNTPHICACVCALSAACRAPARAPRRPAPSRIRIWPSANKSVNRKVDQHGNTAPPAPHTYSLCCSRMTHQKPTRSNFVVYTWQSLAFAARGVYNLTAPGTGGRPAPCTFGAWASAIDSICCRACL